MTPTLSSEAIVARNLGVVDAHFHNENPVDIDKAIDLYGDTIVWEVPARGVLLRDAHADAIHRRRTDRMGPAAPLRLRHQNRPHRLRPAVRAPGDVHGC